MRFYVVRYSSGKELKYVADVIDQEDGFAEAVEYAVGCCTNDEQIVSIEEVER